MPNLGLKELITHRYDFSKCNEAFETMRNPERIYGKSDVY